MRKRTRLGKGASWNKCSSTLASSTVYSSISSATIATSIISLSLSLHLLFTFYFYFYFFPKWWWRWFQLAFLTKANKLSLKYMYMCMCIYIKGKLPSNLGGCFTLTTYHLPLVCNSSVLQLTRLPPPSHLPHRATLFFFFSIFTLLIHYMIMTCCLLDSSHLFIFVVFLSEPVAYSIQCTPFPFLLNSYSSLSSLPLPI